MRLEGFLLMFFRFGSPPAKSPLRRLILPALDWTRPKDPPISLGQASLLANLKYYNINVVARSWAVNHLSFVDTEVTDFIMQHAHSAVDVALGVFVWNEKATQNILNDLKRYKFSGRIILGGPQISYVKKGLEKFYPQADIFIRGYAESALVRLMQAEAHALTPIKGVHYAGQPDVGFSATADLEMLPSPFLKNIVPVQTFIRWETQRGCPFRCAFCQHRESDVFSKRKQFPLSRVLLEAEWIARNPIIKDVAVLDPTFNSGPYYLEIIDKLIDERYSGKLSLQCRIEMLKDVFLEKIVRLNQTAEVVLEFGLQTIHPNEQVIIDRLNNLRLVEKWLKKVQLHNIKCEVSLIFGLPMQTISSFRQSIEFCQNLNIPVIRAFPLMLLRGTPLYERKKELELIESTDVAPLNLDRVMIDIPHVIASPTFTYQDWLVMAEMAESLERHHGRIEHNKYSH